MGLMILASPGEDTVASKTIVFSISITNVIALLRIEDDGVEDRPGKYIPWDLNVMQQTARKMRMRSVCMREFFLTNPNIYLIENFFIFKVYKFIEKYCFAST